MSWVADKGWVCDRCATSSRTGRGHGWLAVIADRWPADSVHFDACSPSCLVELASRLLPADGGDTPAVETTGAGVPIPGGQHCNGKD